MPLWRAWPNRSLTTSRSGLWPPRAMSRTRAGPGSRLEAAHRSCYQGTDTVTRYLGGSLIPVVPVTIHLPDTLWRAVQALAIDEGNTNTVILRALEAYITATGKRLDARGTVRARSSVIPRQWAHG